MREIIIIKMITEEAKDTLLAELLLEMGVLLDLDLLDSIKTKSKQYPHPLYTPKKEKACCKRQVFSFTKLKFVAIKPQTLILFQFFPPKLLTKFFKPIILQKVVVLVTCLPSPPLHCGLLRVPQKGLVHKRASLFSYIKKYQDFQKALIPTHFFEK